MTELDGIRSFVAVVETGGFSQRGATAGGKRQKSDEPSIFAEINSEHHVRRRSG